MRTLSAISSTLLLCIVSFGYPESPPPAHTGGFGEPTCHFCHFDHEMNSPEGELLLRGLKAQYQPGSSYEVEVVLVRAAMEQAGVQLSARYATGEREGQQAGVFEVVDERLAVDEESNVQYLRQSRSGTQLSATDSAFWQFRWHAPEIEQEVVFHLVANAANGDDSEFGDHIYQKIVTLQHLEDVP